MVWALSTDGLLWDDLCVAIAVDEHPLGQNEMVMKNLVVQFILF